MSPGNCSVAFALLAGLFAAQLARAQRHEIGLALGAVTGKSRSSPGGSIRLGTGVALQANYGVRLLARDQVALYGEIHFLASPLREIGSANPLATRDFASLYVLPGVRVKFLPAGLISPYVAAGAGYGLYEQSLNRIDGQPNPAPRLTHRGALGFGGGADLKVWRFVSARLEVRDFYTGNPSYNALLSGGGQHNVVFSGGIVLRLGDGDE
jgi:hypothetical protein